MSPPATQIVIDSSSRICGATLFRLTALPVRLLPTAAVVESAVGSLFHEVSLEAASPEERRLEVDPLGLRPLSDFVGLDLAGVDSSAPS
ncbi:hypothetical protein R1sor_023556 [Riccia sorocarpa]|uniref:Uncharacterized protein n=1 Tax=Riccia sorocarpa TaxID=122646 RepID=A0ABD3GR78_9MARC